MAARESHCLGKRIRRLLGAQNRGEQQPVDKLITSGTACADDQGCELAPACRSLHQSFRMEDGGTP